MGCRVPVRFCKCLISSEWITVRLSGSEVNAAALCSQSFGDPSLTGFRIHTAIRAAGRGVFSQQMFPDEAAGFRAGEPGSFRGAAASKERVCGHPSPARPGAQLPGVSR